MGDERGPLLDKWKQIVAAIDPEAAEHFSEDGPPDYLFHLFRPTGAGVETLLDGMEHREEVLARLRAVYQAAGDESHGDLYFIVRKPPRATEDRLLDWTRDHLSRMKRVEAELWELEGPSMIEGIEGIDLIAGGVPPRRDPRRIEPLEATLYEIVTELGLALGGSLWARLLDEPLYKIACDYRLAHWILWPEIAGDFPVEDPLAPWFELWRNGASLHFYDEDRGWSFDQNHRVRVWVEATG